MPENHRIAVLTKELVADVATKEPRRRFVGIDPPLTEPISPELVLVDPELARIARAQLPLVPSPFAPAEPRGRSARLDVLPRREPAVEPEPATRAPRGYGWVVAWIVVVVAGGLALTGMTLVSGSRPKLEPAPSRIEAGDRTEASSARREPRRTAPRIGSALALPAGGRARGERAGAPPAALLRAAERKVLKLLPRAPRSKVPSTLVDRRLGLVRSNVQVACQRAARASVLSCVVRPARHRRGEGLYLTYRPLAGRRAAVVWQRYLPGHTTERSNTEARRRRGR